MRLILPWGYILTGTYHKTLHDEVGIGGLAIRILDLQASDPG